MPKVRLRPSRGARSGLPRMWDGARRHARILAHLFGPSVFFIHWHGTLPAVCHGIDCNPLCQFCGVRNSPIQVCRVFRHWCKNSSSSHDAFRRDRSDSRYCSLLPTGCRRFAIDEQKGEAPSSLGSLLCSGRSGSHQVGHLACISVIDLSFRCVNCRLSTNILVHSTPTHPSKPLAKRCQSLVGCRGHVL